MNMPQQKLFTIHTSAIGSNGVENTPKSGSASGGGLEAYFVQGQLFYRLLGEQYTEPTPRSNGYSLGIFEQGVWHFIGIDHEGPKSFGRSSTLRVIVNNKETVSVNMEFPRIAANTQIKRWSFGEHLIGKISSILVCSETIGVSQMQILPRYYQFGFQNAHSLANLHIAFEKSMNKIYMLFTPIRSYRNNAFDAVMKHQGTFFERSGFCVKDPLKFRIAEIGGFQSILPFLYLLRYCDNPENKPNVVNEILKLLIDLLQERYDFQTIAARMDLLRMLSYLLGELTHKCFDSTTVVLIKDLKSILQEPLLVSSFYIDILWNLDLFKLMSDSYVKSEYASLVKAVFETSPEYYSKLFGVQSIMFRLLLNFSVIEDMETLASIMNPLLEVLERAFELSTSETLLTADCVQLISVFTMKCSPAFHLLFFTAFKRILMEVLPSDLKKKCFAILQEQNAESIFLRLLIQTKSVPVKAMCIKAVNLISSTFNLSDIGLCGRIANILKAEEPNRERTELNGQLELMLKLRERGSSSSSNSAFNAMPTQLVAPPTLLPAMAMPSHPKKDIFERPVKRNNFFDKPASTSSPLSHSSQETMNLGNQPTNDVLADLTSPSMKITMPQKKPARKPPSFAFGGPSLDIKDSNFESQPEQQQQQQQHQSQLNSFNLNEGTRQILAPQSAVSTSIAPPSFKGQERKLKKPMGLMLSDEALGNGNSTSEIGNAIVIAPSPAPIQMRSTFGGDTRKKFVPPTISVENDENEEEEKKESDRDEPLMPVNSALLYQQQQSNDRGGTNVVGVNNMDSNNNNNNNFVCNDAFNFEMPDTPYDQMRVANNPGYMQAPSMLNKRGFGGIKFPEFPVSENPVKPPQIMPSGPSRRGSNFSFPDGGGGFNSSGGVEPQMSKKVGQAITFTFNSEKSAAAAVSSTFASVSSINSMNVSSAAAAATTSSESGNHINNSISETFSLPKRTSAPRPQISFPVVSAATTNSSVIPQEELLKKLGEDIDDEEARQKMQDSKKEIVVVVPQKKTAPASRRSFQKKVGGLEINIGIVNENYFGGGGENAPKQTSVADVLKEEAEIAELARKCVLYMSGELVQNDEDFYDSKMPFNFKQSQKPQLGVQLLQPSIPTVQQVQQVQPQLQPKPQPPTVRGMKKIELPVSNIIAETPHRLNMIPENSVSESEDLSFSMDPAALQSALRSPLANEQKSTIQQFGLTDSVFNLNSNKAVREDRQIPFQAQDTIIPSNFSSPDSQQVKSEEKSKDLEVLYIAIMEWLLQRTPGEMDNSIIISDKDTIQDTHVLLVLMQFYSYSNKQLLPLIMQNLQLIIKWNHANCYTLLNYNGFHDWLLDILFTEQIQMMTEERAERDPISAMVWDSALKIHTLLLRHAMLEDRNFIGKINALIAWGEEKKASSSLQATAAKELIVQSFNYLLRMLWLSFLDSIYYECASETEKVISNDVFLKNLNYFIQATYEIVSRPSWRITENTIIPSNFLKLTESSQWIDRQLIDGVVKALEALWNNENLKYDVATMNAQSGQSEIEVKEKYIAWMLNLQRSESMRNAAEAFWLEAPSESSPWRGSLMKKISMMICMQIEDILRSPPKQGTIITLSDSLNDCLAKSEQLMVNYLCVLENARDSKVVASVQKDVLFSPILLLMRTLYSALNRTATTITNELDVKKVLVSRIRNLYLFILLVVKYLDSRVVKFSEFQKQKAASAALSEFGSLQGILQGGVNNVVYELLDTYFTDRSNNCIVNIERVRALQDNFFLDISELYISDAAFVARTFGVESRIYEVVTRECDQNPPRDSFFKSFDRISIIVNSEIGLESNSNSSAVAENAEISVVRQVLLQEESVRTMRNSWKKIWKRLRLFQGIWKLPNIQLLQNDLPFQPAVSLESQEKTFYCKVDKYEARNRMRPFLKVKLVDPEYLRNINAAATQKGSSFNRIADAFPKFYEEKETRKPAQKGGNSSGEGQQEAKVFETVYSTQDDHESWNASSSKRISGNNLLKKKPSNSFGESPETSIVSPSKTGFFFNNIGKNIAKTFKAMLPFQKEEMKVSDSDEGIDKNSLILPSKGEVHFSKRCQWVKTLTVRNGYLSMTDENLLFQYESVQQKQSHIAMTSHIVPDDRKLVKAWALRNIKEVQMRRYILRRTALELFFLDGSSVILNFPGKTGQTHSEEVASKLVRNRKNRCSNLKYHSTLDPRKIVDKSGLLAKWQNRQISNFEYLMHLNALASRSSKDLTQYPVFPWILADYRVQSQQTKIRDLSKPVGAIGDQDRIETYKERFASFDPFQEIPPFHYGSHYSSPAIVFSFLLRIQPFTNGMRILQGNKFDLADRLFYNLGDSFRCAMEDVSDVRELTPELFYMPEVLINLNKEDFGKRQNGERVNDVELPMVAEGDPYRFIVQHRQALESESVSNKLNAWIDLIFGYKQGGREAEKALNVFYHLTYENKVDLDQISSESTRISTETQIINFGQTPSQLFFDKPHPNREPAGDLDGRIISDPAAEIKVFRPTNGNKKRSASQNASNLVNFFLDMPDQAIIALKWISDSRFICLRRNGSITQFKWYSNPVNQSQQTVIPFQCGEDKKREVSLDKLKKVGINPIDVSVSYLEFPCYFLKDSKVLVMGGMWDGALALVNVETDQVVEIYNNHVDTITYITADSKENFLITGSKSGEVIVWKIQADNKLTIRYTFNEHKDRINQIKVSKELGIFVSTSEDGTLSIYNTINGVLYRSISHPSGLSIENIMIGYSPLPCLVFFSNADRTLYSYSVNGQLLASVVEESISITSSIIIRDANFSEILVYGNEKGDLIFRELPFLKLRKVFLVSMGSPVLSIVISKDKRFLLCGCSDGCISVLTDPQLSARSNSRIPSTPSDKSLKV